MTPTRQSADEVDVQRALRDLEERVRQHRRVLGEADGETAAQNDLRAVADNWHISAHLPVTWSVPVVGRGLALAKRVTRLLLRWYINPIVDQQNDFNASVARAFVRVAAHQDAMAGAISALERRVAALETRQAPAGLPGSGREPA